MKKFSSKVMAAVLVGTMALLAVGCSSDTSSEKKSKKDKDDVKKDKIEIMTI